MVNQREIKAIVNYKEKGWQTVFMGAPDLLLFKSNEKGEITEVAFREIKSPTDKLRIEQHIWRKVLKDFLKCDYKVKVIE